MKLHLPDVTLVVADTICHELAAVAVKDCLERAEFGAVRIYTDDTDAFARQLDCQEISYCKVEPFNGLAAVWRHLWYVVPWQIETGHVLMVQWDSGIVEPSRWSTEFLQCDYVGAPWGWHGDAYEVGNGGFSLRSRRLMQYLVEHRDMYPMRHPEDDVLCRRYRPALELAGFRWASTDLALQFSFERSGFSGLERHFGYHGIFNWPRVFSVAALQQRILLMLGNKYLSQPKHLAELLQAMKVQLADGGCGEAQPPVRRPA